MSGTCSSNIHITSFKTFPTHFIQNFFLSFEDFFSSSTDNKLTIRKLSQKARQISGKCSTKTLSSFKEICYRISHSLNSNHTLREQNLETQNHHYNITRRFFSSPSTFIGTNKSYLA